MLGLHGSDYFRKSVSRANNSWTEKLEQVQKTTDIQVNYVSIYTIFWESATQNYTIDTTLIYCLALEPATGSILYYVVYILAGMWLGDPSTHSHLRLKIWIPDTNASRISAAEVASHDADKLAVNLLLALFDPRELATGNCTKPRKPGVRQLDPDKVLAIKCKKLSILMHEYIRNGVMVLPDTYHAHLKLMQFSDEVFVSEDY